MLTELVARHAQSAVDATLADTRANEPCFLVFLYAPERIRTSDLRFRRWLLRKGLRAPFGGLGGGRGADASRRARDQEAWARCWV